MPVAGARLRSGEAPAAAGAPGRAPHCPESGPGPARNSAASRPWPARPPAAPQLAPAAPSAAAAPGRPQRRSSPPPPPAPPARPRRPQSRSSPRPPPAPPQQHSSPAHHERHEAAVALPPPLLLVARPHDLDAGDGAKAPKLALQDLLVDVRPQVADVAARVGWFVWGGGGGGGVEGGGRAVRAAAATRSMITSTLTGRAAIRQAPNWPPTSPFPPPLQPQPHSRQAAPIRASTAGPPSLQGGRRRSPAQRPTGWW
jgi:hypothetical protein